MGSYPLDTRAPAMRPSGLEQLGIRPFDAGEKPPSLLVAGGEPFGRASKPRLSCSGPAPYIACDGWGPRAPLKVSVGRYCLGDARPLFPIQAQPGPGSIDSARLPGSTVDGSRRRA